MASSSGNASATICPFTGRVGSLAPAICAGGGRPGRPGNGARIHYFILGVDKHYSAMYSAAMLSKELVAASTVPLVLSILGEGESYGYALIQRVRELSGGGIEWTEGMLYPVLHWMLKTKKRPPRLCARRSRRNVNNGSPFTKHLRVYGN